MIDVFPFHLLPIAVFGLGRSGIAAARALIASEAEVWAWDDDKDAARLIAAGIAEKVGPAKKANKVEKATAKKVVETATTD